ncbi:MAG: XrtA/PEP-CTERM system TPR-repeat protein PrsT [Pseudomonadota bacterium]
MTRVRRQTGLRRLGQGLCLAVVMAVAGCGVDDAGRMERANAAFEAGDYRAAAIDARAVLQNDSRNLRARLLLARSALNVGDGASAEKEFRRALDLGLTLDDVGLELAQSVALQQNFEALLEEFPPDSLAVDDRPELFLLRGGAQRALGDSDAAIESLEEAVRLDSSLVKARLALLGIALDKGELNNASLMIEQLKQDAPEEVSLWLLSARYNVIRQQMDAATADFEQGLSIARSNDDPSEAIAPLQGLFDIALGSSDGDTARARLSELQAIAPDAWGTTFRAAKIEFLEEDWEASKALLQETQKQVDAPPIRELLGFVHYKLGEYAQADMMLSSIYRTEGVGSESVLVLAEVRRQMNRPEPIVDTLAPLIEGSEDPEALSSALRITLASGSIEDSIMVAERNVSRFPDNALLLLDLATAYSAAGRLKEADEVLSQLETGESGVAMRRDILMTLTQIRGGDFNAASITASKLASDYPDEPVALMMAGDTAVRLGNLELAKTRFTAASELSPEDPVPLKNLARVAAAQGDYDAANALLNQSLELLPDDVGAFLGLSQVALLSGDRTAAVDWLKRAVQADPSATSVSARLARLQIEEGELSSARTTIVSAMQSAPNDTTLALMLGEVSLASGEVEDATEQFGAVIGMDETLPGGYRGLALAYLASDRADDARTVLRRATRRGASDLRSDMMLAMLYVRDGDYGQATRLIDDWKSKDSSLDYPYLVEGELKLAREETAAAAEAFERAWQRRKAWNTAARHAVAGLTGDLASPMSLAEAFSAEAPDHLPSKVLLAQGYQQLGDYAKAIPQYERAVAIAPDNALLRNNLAWTLFANGDDGAVVHARAAYEADGDNPAIADTLGWILARQGQTDEALPLLESAFSKIPQNREVAWHLAYVAAEQGNAQRARELLDSALAGDVEFMGRAEAQALRDRL